MGQNLINGKVTDDDGGIVAFVNVIEKGTSNGTTTDIDGQFSIEIAQLPATLVFSGLGYETIEVQVANTNPLDITLPVAAEALEEIVVTGLGTSIKRLLSFKITSAARVIKSFAIPWATRAKSPIEQGQIIIV